MRKIIVFIFLLGTGCLSCSETDSSKFDSEKWKNWEETESSMSLRWDMRNDLIETHQLVGFSENEIISLLGNTEQKHGEVFFYNLGVARRGVDNGALRIEFKDDKVFRVEVLSG